MTTLINNVVERFDTQYFYDEPVGVYLLNLPDMVLLFDLPAYSKKVEDYLRSKNKPIIALLSHGSCGTADGKIWQKKLGLKVYLHAADSNHEWLMMKPDVLFKESPHFDKNLEVIHTPGHSSGSVCLLEKTTETLFTGDTFGGTKKGTVRDIRNENHRYDDIPLRLKSCEKLLKYNFVTVLPFHYEIIPKNANKALAEYLGMVRNDNNNL